MRRFPEAGVDAGSRNSASFVVEQRGDHVALMYVGMAPQTEGLALDQ
jgi:hypothetical protein